MHQATPFVRAKNGSWLTALLPCIAFLLYSATFCSAKSMAKEDLIGDADSAQYTGLLANWDIRQPFGDAFRLTGRQLGDRQQSHKIKHVLLLQVFGPIVRQSVRLGVDPWLAAKTPIALLAAVTILLTGILLRRSRQRPGAIIPVLTMLMMAPGMWVYASQPDSWVFTGTLVLGLIVLTTAHPHAILLHALSIGIAMTNNVLIGCLCVAPFVWRLCQGDELRKVVAAVIVTGLLALIVWSGSLAIFSIFDPDLAPHRVVSQLAFAQRLVDPEPRPLWHPATIRLSLEQWMVTAFTSYQHDQMLVGWGLGNTWRTSWIGRVAILIFAATWTWCVRNIAREFLVRRAEFWRVNALLCVVVSVTLSFAVLLHIGTPRGVFLYSPLMAPLVSVIFGLSIGTTSNRANLLWITCSAVAVTAIMQMNWLYATLAERS